MAFKWFRSNHLIVFVLAFVLLVRIVTALPLRQPGYMDAYYYCNVAQSLYRGDGFTDYILWNFLDNPEGLPHPACLYWMPLTSMVIYPFALLFGLSFRVAQVPFILLSTVLAWVACRVSMDLSGKREQAILAVILVAFSGFYSVFWVTTDSFAPFAVVASLALYTAGRGMKASRSGWFALSGGFAGLAHLARADGVLVLGAVLLTLLLLGWRRPRLRRYVLFSCLWAVLVYLAVVSPWFYRNCQEAGSPLGGGGFQTLFLRDYDDLFSYGRELTSSSYLAWGWSAILKSKLQALWFGFQNLLAVNLMIFLAPLSAWGLWTWRKRGELLPFAIYAVLLYLVMTLFFTFPGVRGGLFHSSVALLPWLFAAAACGLERFIQFMARHRAGWNVDTAYPVFFVALILLALLLSSFLYLGSVWGQSAGRLSWNERNVVYVDIGRWLEQKGDDVGLVMVNDAPAFYYFTRRPGMSIPNEELETVVEVAQRYGVSHLVLESDHPHPLQALYEGRQTGPRLELETTIRDARGSPVKVYRLE